jgi:hypothetical protein
MSEKDLLLKFIQGFQNLTDSYGRSRGLGKGLTFQDYVNAFSGILTPDDAKLAYQLANKYAPEIKKLAPKDTFPPILRSGEDPDVVAERILKGIAMTATAETIPPVDKLIEELQIKGDVAKAFRVQYKEAAKNLPPGADPVTKTYDMWKYLAYALLGINGVIVFVVILRSIAQFFIDIWYRQRKRMYQWYKSKARWWKPKPGRRRWTLFPSFSEYHYSRDVSPISRTPIEDQPVDEQVADELMRRKVKRERRQRRRSTAPPPSPEYEDDYSRDGIFGSSREAILNPTGSLSLDLKSGGWKYGS